MNLAAIFALLLSSGVCAQSDFHGSDGSTLSIIVCPHLAPAEPSDTPAETPRGEKRT
jgi:hypothetical protein